MKASERHTHAHTEEFFVLSFPPLFLSSFYEWILHSLREFAEEARSRRYSLLFRVG